MMSKREKRAKEKGEETRTREDAKELIKFFRESKKHTTEVNMSSGTWYTSARTEN